MERHEDVEEESRALPRMTWLSPLRGFVRSGRSFASWGKAKVTRKKQPANDTLYDQQEPRAINGPSHSRWAPPLINIIMNFYRSSLFWHTSGAHSLTCRNDKSQCPCRWPIALPTVNVLGFLQQKSSASAAQLGKICFPQFLTLGGAGLASSEGAIPNCLTGLS